EKLSKTVHGPAKLTDIAPARLVNDFGIDGFRYHFLRDTPFGPDGDFSYERMVDRYNSDLANNLGNLLSRVATVVDKKCGGIGPAHHREASTLVEDARAARGTPLATLGTTVEDSQAAIALARELDGVWATAGAHPHDAQDGLAGLEPLLAEPEIVAVGECGLD